MLGRKFIEEGWHILWRGVLSTDAEIAQVTEDLRDLSDELKTDVNQWPPNTKIQVMDSNEEERSIEISWAALKGEPEATA